MNNNKDKLLSITAFGVLVTGFMLFLPYMVFLPNPQLFESLAMPSLGNSMGLVLYSLASAGAAFVAWGYMLFQLEGETLGKKKVFLATSIGFLLLGLMRLGTAVFPHEPFQRMVAAPAIEFVLFTVIAAIFLLKSRRI